MTDLPKELRFNADPPVVRRAIIWYINGEWHVDLPEQAVTHVVTEAVDALKLVRDWDAKMMKKSGKSVITLVTWHDIPLNFQPPK